MADDALDASRRAFMPAAPSAQPPATTTTEPASNSADDALDASRRKFQTDTGTSVTPQEVPMYHRSFTKDASDLASGALEGVEKIARPAAGAIASVLGPGGWLDRNTGVSVPGMASSDDIAKRAVERLKAYNAGAGQSGFGTAGEVIGQTATTAPYLAGTGALLSKGAQAIESAVPAIEPALSAARTFVSGEAGGAGSLTSRATQAASRATQGAATGAAATALTGNTDQNSLLLGAGGGSVLGSTLSLAAEGVSRVLGGSSSMPSAVADFIQNAKSRFGIDLRASQVPQGLPPTAIKARMVSKLVSGSGVGAEDVPVTKQWREAVARSSGILQDSDGEMPALTKSSIQDARNEIESLQGNYELRKAQPTDLAARLSPIAQSVQTIGGSDGPIIAKQLQSLLDQAQQGTSYRNLLNEVDQNAKLSGSPTVQRTMAGIKDGIHAAIEDTTDASPNVWATQGGNPPFKWDGAFYHRLRGELHNLDILDRAPIGADGQITPQGLGQVVSQSPRFQTRADYAHKALIGMLPPETVNGAALPELSRIGSAIGQPPDAVDKFLTSMKRFEYPISLAHHLATAPLMSLPISPLALGATSLATKGMNAWLGSKFLTNRLINNHGVAPWVNQTQTFAGPLGGIGANALTSH